MKAEVEDIRIDDPADMKNDEEAVKPDEADESKENISEKQTTVKTDLISPIKKKK